MTIEQWNLVKVWKEKRQGHVWIVESDQGRTGYFKFATKENSYHSGSMIANELVSAQLARLLGLPVAELQLIQVRGPDGNMQDGLVSVSVQAKEIVTWRKVDKRVRRKAESYVNKTELLAMVVVFDAWIANVDRAVGKNLILFRNDSSSKYEWYLIDHGLALYGAPKKWSWHKWDESYWKNLWLFHHVPEGLLRLQSSFDALEPMIKRIEQISDKAIDSILQNVPKKEFDERERQFIRRLLISRRQQLREIITNWVNYKGLKEYNRR